jgi:hypothetical protein
MADLLSKLHGKKPQNAEYRQHEAVRWEEPPEADWRGVVREECSPLLEESRCHS